MGLIQSFRVVCLVATAFLITGCASSVDVSWIKKDKELYVPKGLTAQQTMNVSAQALTKGLSQQALQKSLRYMAFNASIIPNRDVLVIVDYSQHSLNKRLFLLDFEKQSVEALLTTHGAGSDPDHDGIATEFSNEIGSHKTSLGFYLAQERYVGKYGLSLRLDGLQNTNYTARDRAVVLHSNDYVDDRLPYIGRSWGCFVVSPSVIEDVVARMEGGSLLYAHHPTIQSEIVDNPMVTDNRPIVRQTAYQGG